MGIRRVVYSKTADKDAPTCNGLYQAICIGEGPPADPT